MLDLVGRGGMGEVYAAYDPELDRKVALKLLHARPSAATSAERARARLLREAKAMARLSHPNVVVVHDAGTFDDRVFIAMEFVDGRRRSRPGCGAKPRRWREILDVFLAAGRGLAAAHAAGIVHRDFKPQNVMVARRRRRARHGLRPGRDAADGADDGDAAARRRQSTTPTSAHGSRRR